MRLTLSAACPLLVLVFAQWAGAEDRAFNSGSVKIRHVEEGNGDPVVLVHGLSRNSEVIGSKPGSWKPNWPTVFTSSLDD